MTSREDIEIFLARLISEENVSATCSTNADNAPGIASSVTYDSTAIARPGHEAVIETYRRYFGTVYHVPFQIPVETAPVTLLEQLHSLVNVGDYLGELQPLVAPVEAHIYGHMISFRPYVISECPAFLRIARKLELSWLFKDMVCFAMGDHARQDEEISWDFGPDISPLILEKRRLLRAMIQEIDEKLLSMDLGIVRKPYNADVIHSAHEGLKKLVHKSRACPRKQYAHLYIKLTKPEFVYSLVRENGLISDRLYREVCEIISPLLESCVSPLWNKDPTIYLRHPNLMCVACEDEDLPWKR